MNFSHDPDLYRRRVEELNTPYQRKIAEENRAQFEIDCAMARQLAREATDRAYRKALDPCNLGIWGPLR
jgi:hypothetical protein